MREFNELAGWELPTRYLSSLALLSANSGAGEMWRMMAQARNLPLIVPVSVFHTDNNPIN